MEDARALLDSLMGGTRNAKVDKDKRKKADVGKSGEGFKRDSVCKLHLAGFCPEHEQVFYNTKRDLGTCSKTHFEMHKEEFMAHPEKKKYLAGYELQLLNHLSGILRQVKDRTAREKIKFEDTIQRSRAKGAAQDAKNPKNIASELLVEAEELATKGEFEESKRKIAQAKEWEEKAKEWDEQGGLSIDELVCGICGERKDTQKRSAFRHEAGKFHQAVLMLQKLHAELREKEEKGKLRVDREVEEEERELREQDAKERRAKEREAKEREREERRAREERQVKDREEREAQQREAKAREEAKEREEKDARDQQRRMDSRSPRAREDRQAKGRENEREVKEAQQRDAKARQEKDARDRRGHTGSRSPRAREERQAKEQEKEREVKEVQQREAKAREEKDARGRNGEAAKLDSSHRRRDPDLERPTEDDGRMKKRRTEGADDGTQKPDGNDKEKDSSVNRFRVRFLEKQFMDLLVMSRLGRPTSTYEQLEEQLGNKDQWKDCPEKLRKEGVLAYVDMLKSFE